MDVRAHLRRGQVIPAHPLALTPGRRLDERHQRALTRYYVAAGAGGIAVGVHTTQFAIRRPDVGLYRPVLELAAETAASALASAPRPFARIAGICGRTAQALAEADTARSLGYHAGLVSLADWADDPDEALVRHCEEIAAVMPVFGFYLQPAVGGRALSYAFWRRFAEIPNVWAIKIAPFNRYQTLDVVRAVADAGRDDIALYTGNDDHILDDLLTPFPVRTPDGAGTRYVDGALLGQFAVWTRTAVALLERVRRARAAGALDPMLLRHGAALTDANGAIFDATHAFAGCIPGIHEILRRQGLLAGTWCLDPRETLSPGQLQEIDRVCRDYPELRDDDWVAARLSAFLAD